MVRIVVKSKVKRDQVFLLVSLLSILVFCRASVALSRALVILSSRLDLYTPLESFVNEYCVGSGHRRHNPTSGTDNPGLQTLSGESNAAFMSRI